MPPNTPQTGPLPARARRDLGGRCLCTRIGKLREYSAVYSSQNGVILVESGFA